MVKNADVFSRIEDSGESFDQIDSQVVQDALGAEAAGESQEGGNPFGIAALHRRLVRELISTGGRRGRREAASRKKIPLTDREWEMLDRVTALIRARGTSVSPGQVAGVLLNQSLAEVLLRLDKASPSNTQVSRDEPLSGVELEEKLETILAAAANAEVHLEQLRPIARELLQRMREGRGIESDEGQF